MTNQADFHKALLDQLLDGVYFVDGTRKILYWNAAAERLTGYLASEVVGRHCHDNLMRHVNDRGEALCTDGCPLAETLADGRQREADVYLQHRDGHRVPVRVRVAPVLDSAGKIIGAVEAFADNSTGLSAVERIRQLESMIYIDFLTGVPNRAFTEITLRTRLDERVRYDWPFGVLSIDIDHFKDVNDRFGHGVGDEVLKVVSKTMSGVCRSFDLVGRWGGEEFVVIVANINAEQLHDLAERYRLLVQYSDLLAEGQRVRVTASIGATLARRDDTVESLLKRADGLMYQSKQAGRNRTTSEASVAAA